MKIRSISAAVYKLFASIIVSAFLLTGCVPGGVIVENNQAITQAEENAVEAGIETVVVDPEANSTVIASPTPEYTLVPSATATSEATATLEATASPEKTEAEKMHEYCIKRAKEVGIDLENLQNSNNLWLTEHQGLENLEEAFNTSFTDDRIFKTMIVVGADSLNSQTRYNRAPTTADGKKIMGWIEAIYKKADGQYQLVLLPTNIWDIKSEIMWSKQAIFGEPQYYTGVYNEHKFNKIINDYSSPNTNPDFDYFAGFIGNLAKQDYWVGPGAFISFDSDYPATTAGGAGTLEEPPFSQEQQLGFQKTGETDFFPYFMLDPNTRIKQPIIYPFINYGTLSKTDNYPDQAFVEEFVNWFTGENKQYLNPAGPPYIRHWQALP
ncbi:MAG: hypothetical protein PHW11_06480 [Anaerolineaceae bacterium]|nr:hypothetical protein [Anaerolineaceae bacterium]MDD4041886.1 hypothetical protein [Anaerolineaceae bacterium]